MPDALAITLAEAVKDKLNADTFSQDFTATRAYLPRFEVPDLETLRVTVVLGPFSGETISRADDQETYMIDVGIQKKVDIYDNDVVDPLLYLVDQIKEAFRAYSLGTDPDAICMSRQTVPGSDGLYAPQDMAEMGVFTSVLRLEFLLVR